MVKIKQSSPHLKFDCFGWSDSTIVLAWLQDHPRKWKTFVANRTSEILTIFPENVWRHVSAAQNPADCVSRGVSPEQLLSLDMWWKGPPWLSKESSSWSQQKSHGKIREELPEMREIQVHIANAEANAVDNIPCLLELYSSLYKILRITAWCLRFMNRLQNKPRETGFITTSEIQTARNIYIKWAQRTIAIMLKLKC